MTLTKALVDYMKTIEHNTDIPNISNSLLAIRYYNYTGVDTSVSAALFFVKMNNGSYPQYSSVTRAIRKARTIHPRWKKHRKQKQIDKVKQEVGY